MTTIHTQRIDWYDGMRLTCLWLALVAVFCQAAPAQAQITVTASGPGGTRSQIVAGTGGRFDLELPLNRNAVNTVTVTATDSSGQTASHELKVTQLSLDQIVVSKVTAERLSVEQVKQLVSDGVIALENPANYNVSKFDIVLTIGSKPVPISVAVATAIAEEVTGWEQYRMPEGTGTSGGGNPPPAPTQIIVFDEPIPSAPGRPRISIPGVIIIEGNIKSLKEFYTVRLLLLNTSGIFTLKDVVSNISFPDGGLTSIAPADGIISFGSIFPGDGSLPGQAERQFIIRGDAIGIRQVKVGFGGTVAGPGIPDESPVPFNGSAVTQVEVKGPPTFLVKATHPASVAIGVPYEFKVDITNTGDIAALYTSLDLSVGADGRLVSCDAATPPTCTDAGAGGTETRTFGDILPGKTVSATFTIIPSKTGLISSCLGVSDQNITLQVLVGPMGCLVGQSPPEQGVPDGTPTVSVVPTPNTLGVSINSAVAAFFTQEMNPATITTGSGGTFNVFDRANNIVPGILSLNIVNGKTVAIWQAHDGNTNRLAPSIEYTVVLTTGIANSTGVPLYNAWTSRFTTTGEALNDLTPPTLTMSVDPPVNPSYVLPGQLVKVNAYAADQGSGVVRVELRIKDLTLTESSYLLVDRKVVFTGDLPPHIFTIDSAQLVAGHTYQLLATAYDYMMNGQNATISLVIAASAAAPTITLPAPPAGGIPQGISVSITPDRVTGGVTEVRYFLDGAQSPFSTVSIPPYQAGTGTLTLALGNHAIRAVALDALGQTGEATYAFALVANPNKPQIDLNGTVSGATYIVGSSFVVSGTATDPLGIASVTYRLDGSSAPVAVGTQPFTISTANLALGSHTITAVAVNTIGATSTLSSTFVVVALPNGAAPAAPVISSLSVPANGSVTLAGTSVAGARIDITNVAQASGINAPQAFGITVNANASGQFSAAIAAAVGDVIHVVAYDYTTSQQPSTAATATVLAPPVLTGVSATPGTMSFVSANAWQDITVTGSYSNGTTSNLTNQAAYSSSNPSVASVNAGGRVVALKSGGAIITASVGGMTALVAVTVEIVTLASITVDPAAVDLAAIGQSRQLVVTAHYSDSTVRTITSGVSFVSASSDVATVSAAGLVASVGNGTTSVTVYLPGVPPVSVPVTVNTANDTRPQILILSPTSGSTVQRGDIVSVSVRATDAVGGVSRVVLSVSGSGNQIISTEARQVSPASHDVTSVFSFTVPDSLAIGGSLAVAAGAEDTGNQSASPVTINLSVVDTTPPTVAVTAPASQTRYNYGDTVSLTVSASDRVGVTSLRYATTGGVVLSGSQQMAQASPTAHTFSFTIPFGFSNPDVRILAYATDASGNEGAAAPVDIVVTSADIIAPETHVTAVDAPGASATTSVTYHVDSGLADLDHVEIYFRRNAIGTYNRYTDADHGNPEGKFVPPAGGGGTGTVAFDSTKMGGDGAYEFYSVGVDQAGNREAAPVSTPPQVLPDETATFDAGTVWTVITSPATAGEGDASYDSRNIRVSGTTFTVNGAHSFRNVDLLNGAVLTHTAATASSETRLALTAWTVSIDATSSINVNGKGYLGGSGGDGYVQGRTLGNVPGASAGAGGSYGGGGGGYGGSASNGVYGDLNDPKELGSGGGAWAGHIGGNGGGLVTLNAINVAVDGNITSNGSHSSGSAAGDGSGGGINITAATLSGRGTIDADGGGNNVGSGAGGGRIAIIAHADMSTMSTTDVRALGGFGPYANGANGTVVFIEKSKTALILSGQGPSSPWTDLTIPAGRVFDSVVVGDNARIIAHDTLTVTEEVLVTGNSILVHDSQNTNGLVITAKTVRVDEGSAIDATGRGYLGGSGGNGYVQGRTLGNVYGAGNGAGGSYGGVGAGYQRVPSGPIYGDPKNPVYLGSGGGAYGGSIGGNGGGRITINATESIVVNGAIRADGGESGGSAAGDGSGGSILLHTSRLAGTGVITAHGGGDGSGVGGGGGRIAVYCDYVDSASNLADLYSIAAFGRTGNFDTRQATAGTVFVKYSNQENGSLYVDAGLTDGQGSPNGSSAESTVFTPLNVGVTAAATSDTLTTDGLTAIHPDSLSGLRINPDINQRESFVIQSNTDTTITVVTPNEHGIAWSAMALAGKTYGGSYLFDNVTFRRGGSLMLGDRLEVAGTMTIGEYGRLTHNHTTATFVSWLDLRVNNLLIDQTGSIDVTGRGYVGGSGGNGYVQGRTLGNVLGGSAGTGGSYGGLATGYEGRTSNATYGSLTYPADLGSGGGAWAGSGGGNGGGLVVIKANNMVVNGTIMSNGGESAGSAAGDGSGGTVNITTASLSGTGTIQARGGGNGDGSGGGGGRIAINHSGSLSMSEGDISAIGGTGQFGSPGGNGTVYLTTQGQTYGDLIVDGNGTTTPADSTRIPGGYTFNNITIRNGARVVVPDQAMTVTDVFLVTGNSLVSHDAGSEAGLVINAGLVQVDQGSSISATGKGYLGGSGGNGYVHGRTLGDVYGASEGAGGSYGGLGGGYGGRSSYLVYGDAKNPVFLGSGGGAWAGQGAGNGGGRITITATESIVVDGAITANGGDSAGSAAGNGSGGSILLHTSGLAGTGSITAHGGGTGGGVGGGGGRIAIFCDAVAASNNLNNLRNIAAFSGHGQFDDRPASAGTLYIKYGNGEDYLYIDDNVVGAGGIANGTASQATPLSPIGFGSTSRVSDTTLVTDGLAPLLPGGLADLRLNPDSSQRETFRIVSNSADAITVVSPNENGSAFGSIAGEGKIYSGFYEFDNVMFRRGGNLMGSPLLVKNTMTIGEYGVLTQYPTTTTVASRLDVTVGTLNLDSTGSINVDGKGYAGGSGGNGYVQGRTVGNFFGSSAGAGGSYGGFGGIYSGSSNGVYGSDSDPVDLGSGGGAWAGSNGGSGGGLLFLTAGQINLSGTISANGALSGGSAAGGGSGGSINIHSGTLTGAGFIRADGGGSGAGGGGGRIAIHFSGSVPIFQVNIRAIGGTGPFGSGGSGTVYVQ